MKVEKQNKEMSLESLTEAMSEDYYYHELESYITHHDYNSGDYDDEEDLAAELCSEVFDEDYYKANTAMSHACYDIACEILDGEFDESLTEDVDSWEQKAEHLSYLYSHNDGFRAKIDQWFEEHYPESEEWEVNLGTISEEELDDIMSYLGYLDFKMPTESLNEADSELGLKQAKAFYKYLKANDGLDVGPSGEDYALLDNIGDGEYEIELDSQAAYTSFKFFPDGSVEVYVQTEDEPDLNGVYNFKSYNEFVDWYRDMSMSWTPDLGYNLKHIGEAMEVNEEDETFLTEDAVEGDRAQELADYLGIDVDEVEPGYYDNSFKADGQEFYVLTYDEAEELAKEQVLELIDEMGIESFSPDFQEDILENYVDEEAVDELIDEEIEYFRDQEEDEETAEWLENLSLSDRLGYIYDTYGPDGFKDWAKDHIDWDEVAEEVVRLDGPENSLATYDGNEIQLDTYYAYRID